MIVFTPGIKDDDKCVWCHRSVDLTRGTQRRENSSGTLRKHVDVALCALCHGPSGPGIQFYKVELSSLVTEGAELYELLCASCHGELANSDVKGESAGEIEEALIKNKGGMGPLDVFSTEQIQAIADALARVGGDDD
jgi:cytochrome c553